MATDAHGIGADHRADAKQAVVERVTNKAAPAHQSKEEETGTWGHEGHEEGCKEEDEASIHPVRVAFQAIFFLTGWSEKHASPQAGDYWWCSDSRVANAITHSRKSSSAA